MCKQAERDHESKKLVVLMERVKRQIAERENPGQQPKRPVMVTGGESGVLRLPSRSAPFDR
jgi:predicted Rossmann-fold nucleotide-binding protein